MSTAKYHLSSVVASYGKILGVAIDELTIADGGFYVLTGPNGSGKSTLMSILAFLHRPAEGTIHFDGVPVSWSSKECLRLRRRVTLLHQQPYLFSGSVADNVAFGPRVRGAEKEEIRAVVAECLQRVGLEGFENRVARKLSGGESRRVAFARALACKPEVLLLDEPEAHVDRASAALLESLVTSLAANGMTIVLSTHNDLLGERLGAKAIHLEDGRLAETQQQLSFTRLPHFAGGIYANS